MSEDKSLPQDEEPGEDQADVDEGSVRGKLPQDEPVDEGPVPETRHERIKVATANGGLKSRPASFSDEYTDWEVIKSDNPFEVLYIDYRMYDRIDRAVIDGNYNIIKKFWTDTTARAMSSQPTARRYGGMDALQMYPQLLQKAYANLTVDVDAPKRCFEQIINKKLETLKPDINNLLVRGEYTPDMASLVGTKGQKIGLTETEITSSLLRILKEKEFGPEVEGAEDPLSIRWYSVARKEEIEKEKVQRLKKEIDAIIAGMLADGEFEPNELFAIKKKAQELDFQEERALSFLEQRMYASGFTPDTTDDTKTSDSIYDRLSVPWRTEAKHLEVAKSKFIAFLDGRLKDGIYQPSEHYGITENAPDYLKRNAVKLKEILIEHLKEKKFKPVAKFQPGHDLSVEWRTDWGKKSENSDGAKKQGDKDQDSKPKWPKILAWSVIFVGIAAFLLWKFYPPQVVKENPPPPPSLAELHIASTPDNAMVTIDGQKKGVTPLVVHIAPGEYTLAISKVDYETETHQINAENGVKKDLSYSLQTKKDIPPDGGSSPDTAPKEREISGYLAEGKQYYSLGKYEPCIDKLKEVLKRDPNNREATELKKEAEKRLKEIEDEFKNPEVGRSR